VSEVNTNSFIANIQSERNIELNYPYISEKNPNELIFKSDDEIFAKMILLVLLYPKKVMVFQYMK